MLDVETRDLKMEVDVDLLKTSSQQKICLFHCSQIGNLGWGMGLELSNIIKTAFSKTSLKQKWETFKKEKWKEARLDKYEVDIRIEESYGGASDSMPDATSGAKN